MFWRQNGQTIICGFMASISLRVVSFWMIGYLTLTMQAGTVDWGGGMYVIGAGAGGLVTGATCIRIKWKDDRLVSYLMVGIT